MRLDLLTVLLAFTVLNPRAESAVLLKPLWNFTVPAYVTELEVASESGNVAVSTILDLEKSQGDNRLYYFNKLGRKIWDYLLPAQARTLEISADGNLVIMSLRNDLILALSDTGKKLWERKGTCRAYPLVWEKKLETLCFYDDDAASQIVGESQSTVEWYDAEGKTKKIFSYGKDTPDALGFVIHPDQHSFLVWFPGGKIVWQTLTTAAGPDPKIEWSVKGSVIRAQFNPDGNKIEALALESPNKRLWTQWDLGQKKITHTLPLAHAVSQWKWLKQALSFYGNAKEGQVLYQSVNPFAPNAQWTTRREPAAGNYHARLDTDADSGLIISAWQRGIEGINEKGVTQWSLPETRDEGNFIYHRYAEKISPKTVAEQLIVLGEENQIKVFSIPQ